MNVELETLEAKIEQVVALVHLLRAENEVLKNQMTAAEAERKARDKAVQAQKATRRLHPFACGEAVGLTGFSL